MNWKKISTCAIEAGGLMYTRRLSGEQGSIQLLMLVWLVIFAAFFLALSLFIRSETERQFFQARERKAFYVAQSGLEYGIGRFLRSDPAQLSNWSETVEGGDSTTCEVVARLLPGNRVLIQATGRVPAYTRSLQARIRYRNPGGGAPLQIEQIIWDYVGW